MFPLRYNPVKVVVERIDDSTTVVDAVWNSSVGGIKRTVFEIEGQVSIQSQDYNKLTRSQTGDLQKSRGEIFISSQYLQNTGKDIRVGDKIKSFGDENFPIDGVVVQVRPESPLNGRFLFLVVEFEQDRIHNSVVKK